MKLTVGNGIDKYLRKLENLYKASDETCGKAIYQAADVVTDAIRRNLNNIPTDERYVSGSEKLIGPKAVQKEALKEVFGISKIRKEYGLNVKVGFDGYNKVKTKKYPKGQPNPMIARSVESGTSFMRKNPFVEPAIRETKDKAERLMAQVVDQEVDKIMNR